MFSMSCYFCISHRFWTHDYWLAAVSRRSYSSFQRKYFVGFCSWLISDSFQNDWHVDSHNKYVYQCVQLIFDGIVYGVGGIFQLMNKLHLCQVVLTVESLLDHTVGHEIKILIYLRNLKRSFFCSLWFSLAYWRHIYGALKLSWLHDKSNYQGFRWIDILPVQFPKE